ncbi:MULTISPECIES: helix-turn-helix domain-containing protein [unclassified Azospirillum]|uniref:helix-turn-helix domain-containing protein n=1 Tax=unclassified Azospirillum TaxID=2630922 RepID=UPI000B700283|nr:MULTISPECIES: helix-turn-helix transcriptional regulator [unclassified Azospirillum]SNT09320.1 Helix-turn-helix [Azospirillum sp. RU38E]SNT24933.1 Helix-turn-helix [Azospirillum sp. RU37A]
MIDSRTFSGALATLRRQGHSLDATYTGLIGLVIAVLRREKGWSQNQLAKHSGVSQPTVSRIELGEADITVPQIDAIARTLECRPGLLFDLADMLRDTLREHQVEVAAKSTTKSSFNVAGPNVFGQSVPVSGSLMTGGPVGFLIGTLLSTMILSKTK